MDFFNRKKIAELQRGIGILLTDRITLFESVQRLSKEVQDLWATNDYHEKVLKSIPQVKRCMGCSNFKIDKKGFPICDCGNDIFTTTDNCQYSPK